ncbi:MAG: LysR family transcriptional regulator [Nakamurella sp.]
MELRQLEYFLAVVEEANFTRAAERVHVSQSGVSAQIRQLERELGQPLLDRSERTIRVTAAGAEILPMVRAALGAVDATRQIADELAGLGRGRVRVAMVTGCTVAVLFDALAAFHEQFPAIAIVLAEDASDRLADGVRNGRFDVALLGTAQSLPPGVKSQLVADERLVAAVPPGHPLAVWPTIELAALGEYPLITLPVGAGVRSALDTACAAVGFRAHVALEASSPEVVAGLAERGLGVAILSESMAGAHPETLHAIPITDPTMTSRLELAWSTGPAIGPAAGALVRHLRDAFAVAGSDGQ